MNDCKHERDWFDRTICPEPCGSMHTRCSDCGVVLDRVGCYFDPVRVFVRDTIERYGDVLERLGRE